MKTLIQENHNYTKTFVAVKMTRRAKKVEFHLAIKIPGLAFFSTDLDHFFGSIFVDEFGVMLRREGVHKPVFASDLVRIQFLGLQTDLIE